MGDFGDLIGLLVFVVFIVIAIARKFTEQRDVTGRQQDMQRQAPRELPEATRRMLYGDDVPTARARTHDEGDGEPPVLVAPRREPNVPTAQPRQGQPRRVVPPPVAPRQSTARSATASPARQATPARRPDAPQRERAQAPAPFRPHEEEHRRAAPEQRRQAPAMRQAPQTQHTVRREAPPPVVQPQRTGKRAPKARPIPAAPKPRAARQALGGRYFDDRDELRRAIVLREILGPPKAFEGLD